MKISNSIKPKVSLLDKLSRALKASRRKMHGPASSRRVCRVYSFWFKKAAVREAVNHTNRLSILASAMINAKCESLNAPIKLTVRQ